MKFNRSIILLSAGLAISTCLHAQQMKMELNKEQPASVVPPPGNKQPAAEPSKPHTQTSFKTAERSGTPADLQPKKEEAAPVSAPVVPAAVPAKEIKPQTVVAPPLLKEQ